MWGLSLGRWEATKGDLEINTVLKILWIKYLGGLKGRVTNCQRKRVLEALFFPGKEEIICLLIFPSVQDCCWDAAANVGLHPRVPCDHRSACFSHPRDRRLVRAERNTRRIETSVLPEMQQACREPAGVWRQARRCGLNKQSWVPLSIVLQTFPGASEAICRLRQKGRRKSWVFLFKTRWSQAGPSKLRTGAQGC